VLKRAGLDVLAERTGVAEDLAAVGIRISPARVVGRLIACIVVLAGLVQAADVLQLAPLADSLRGLLHYTPHLVLAAVIVLVGISIADTLAQNASGALSRAGVIYHGSARILIRSTVVVLSILIALQQLTIESGFLLDVLLVVLAGASLALGLAGAWGARSFFENLVAGHYVERHLAIGDSIRFDGAVGVVELLEATSVTIRGEDERRTIVPNAAIARAAFERHR
jgi:small-conductance mechanosensitive channel